MTKTVKITRDTIIEGKWYGKKFIVVKLIGNGGTASIFLVKEIPAGKQYAMKISTGIINIDSEHQILCSLKGIKYIPQVYYRDDCIIQGIAHFFFIMSYFRGENLKEIRNDSGISTKGILKIMLIVTNICSQLNRYNIYYCDLKPENLIFDYNSNFIYLIDFGGIVGKGESISHFTPLFDRASWGKGERIADDNYQIFALSMILAQLLIGKPVKRDRGFPGLINVVKNSCLSKDLKKVIIKGLGQKHKNLEVFGSKLLPLCGEVEKYEQLKEKRIRFAINLCFLASLVVFCITLMVIN